MCARDLGKRIKEIRKECGMSQEVLAEKSGLSPSYISRIECGKAGSIGAFTLASLAAALHVPVGRLLSEDVPEAAAEITEVLEGCSPGEIRKIIEILRTIREILKGE